MLSLIAAALLAGAPRPAQAPAPAPAGPILREVGTAAELVRAAGEIGPSGGTIRLRPGVYVLAAPLRFARVNHVNLVGSGFNTTIQRSGDGDAIVFEDCAFCTVRDLMAGCDLSAKSGSVVVMRGQCSSCTVDFCRLCNAPGSGLLMEGDAKAPQSSNVVSRCHFIDNAGDQLHLRFSNDFMVSGCQFGAHRLQKERAPRTGGFLDHASAGSYVMNFHWGNRVAVRLSGACNFNRLQNNRLEESREVGLRIGEEGGDGCYLNIVTGNTLHTNSQDETGKWPAVEAFGACDLTFCQNQVFSWDSNRLRHRNGVVMGKGCRTWIVKENVVRHVTGAALVFEQGAGHIVGDNQLDAAPPAAKP